MKKILRKFSLKNSVKLIICVVVASVLLSSCIERQAIENFKGGVIYNNDETHRGYKSFIIKKDGKFIKVFVYELDYNLYKVGDTIK